MQRISPIGSALALALGSLLIVGAGCGADDAASRSAARSAGAPTAAVGNIAVDAGSAAPHEVRVTAKRFSFSPPEIRVKTGEKVRLIVTSEDVTHGLSIPTFNVNMTIQPGTPSTAEFVADRQGTFPFFCNTFCGSGHGDMRGTLIVE
ncbi:MAG: hypothetical protein RL272_1288 [Candidatus Parcubacteria bacterium]|jgi:cytochrome c oxidase subunit 2